MQDPMEQGAQEAAEVLKSLANPRRLRILCALVPGRLSVGELQNALGASQSYVSGQLLKLRAEGLVACDKEGRAVFYRLSDPRVKPVLERLYEVFCPIPPTPIPPNSEQSTTTAASAPDMISVAVSPQPAPSIPTRKA